MPRSCCIVGCQTGYKSNPDTFVSTFSFPKNESLRKKWINVIQRKDLIVTKNSAVCANHFTEDQIITKWTSGFGDNKVCINLKYPKLKEDAIPCLFPGPKYLSKIIKKRKSPTKRINLMCTPTDSKKMQPLEVNFNVDKQNPESIELLEYPNNMSTNQDFENICSGIKCITLPSNWKYEISQKKNNITFYTIKSNENDDGIYIEKQIILETNMIIKCKLYNINFDIQNLSVNSKIISLDGLISVLRILNTKHICSGGPLVGEFDGITVNCAEVAFQNRWRHKKCEYLIDSSSSKNKCIFCERLRNAFRVKKSRLSAGKSTRLVLPPIKKKQSDQLRNE